MRTLSAAVAVFAAMCIGLPATGSAQEKSKPIDIGKREFTANCAVCHGTSGKGNGPLAGMISQKVADLTVISKNNKGVFPFAQIYEVIDGRYEVKGHGTRDMPIWGGAYNAEAPQWLGLDYSRGDSEAFVRGRILALVGYIYTLQAK